MINKKSRRFLILYIFIIIFQPPFFPVSLIYITGIATLLYLVLKGSGKLSLKVMQESGMFSFYKILFFMTAYLIIISVIDSLFIDRADLIGNRLRVINQLAVLTLIELICVWFVLQFSKEHGFAFDDLLECVAIAGSMQGMCSLLAYLFPQIRNLFLTYNSSIFSNLYVIERRGYGFSAMLLDTYGYGMGLIAGLALLSGHLPTWKKAIYISLAMLSVLLNARTGLIVFLIAIVIYLFRARDRKTGFIKSIFAILAVYLIYTYALPWLMSILRSSQNITIRWAGDGIFDAYQLFTTRGELNDATFLSDFSHLPTNFFEMMFGSGHNVYGLVSILGFHSDVGYINLLWEFGVFGSFIVLLNLILLFYKSYRVSDSITKYSVIFLAISYFIVMIKAILIGYNPGVVVTYIVCFALIFFRPGLSENSDRIN